MKSNEWTVSCFASLKERPFYWMNRLLYAHRLMVTPLVSWGIQILTNLVDYRTFMLAVIHILPLRKGPIGIENPGESTAYDILADSG